MEAPLVIVIAVDGLRATALGTYGNTFYPTPELNRLAAASEVFDWFLADSPHCQDFYRAVWYGTHTALPQRSASDSLPSRLAAQGVSTSFLTDAAEMVPMARASGFAGVERLQVSSQEPVSEIGESAIAHCFSAAIEPVAAWHKEALQQGGGLFWLHLQGLTGPWDAPLELRMSLLDEEDEQPILPLLPPRSEVVSDSEAAFGLQVSYAAQVAVLDACLASFFASIAAICPLERINFVLVGTRGFSLGEHGLAGYDCDSLYSEHLHLPCLIRCSGTAGPVPRRTGFHHPSDLIGILHSFFDSAASISGQSATDSSLAVATSPTQWMVRTPGWMLLAKKHRAGERLFAKPDDCWEMNDVASRCGDIVEQLKAVLANEKLPEIIRSSDHRDLPRELIRPRR